MSAQPHVDYYYGEGDDELAGGNRVATVLLYLCARALHPLATHPHTRGRTHHMADACALLLLLRGFCC